MHSGFRFYALAERFPEKTNGDFMDSALRDDDRA
jgi:hypothetical protein